MPLDVQEIPIPSRFRNKEILDKSGLTIFLSPYDKPLSIKAYHDSDSSWFILECFYLTPDEDRKLMVFEDVDVELGKKSGKLYKLFFKVKEDDISGSYLQNKISHILDLVLKSISQGKNPNSRQEIILNSLKEFFASDPHLYTTG